MGITIIYEVYWVNTKIFINFAGWIKYIKLMRFFSKYKIIILFWVTQPELQSPISGFKHINLKAMLGISQICTQGILTALPSLLKRKRTTGKRIMLPSTRSFSSTSLLLPQIQNMESNSNPIMP